MTLLAFYLFGGIVFLLTMAVRAWLGRTYSYWSRVQNSSGLVGADVARAILQANELRHCQVEPQPGKLTDHYDPRNKLIRLSEQNFVTASVASMAVAAHETGHALQDADGYGPLRLRSALMPIASLGAQFGPWAIIGGAVSGATTIAYLGLWLFLGALAFQVLTLPVEFDASRRALDQLEQLGLASGPEKEGAKSVLRAAAMTYVAGVATAVGHFLIILLLAGRSLFPRSAPRP